MNMKTASTTKTECVKNQCKQLNLTAVCNDLDNVLSSAESNHISYLECIKLVMETEINYRKKREMEKRLKLARLPLEFNLDLYDFDADNGLSKQQLNQLRELKWVEQNFNLILMGPSGTGKTFLAGGLCFDAIELGYRAYFETMDDLIRVLKMKDVTRKANTEYRRIINAHLLVIDDIMMFPVNQQDAVLFFNLINELHGKTSLVITTNKSPKEWVDVLQDKVLTTALLDRILHRCEIVKLTGTSYRMKHRKSIFDKPGEE
jgi:DNA replication protein DnaC